jgi:hypothetical protein
VTRGEVVVVMGTHEVPTGPFEREPFDLGRVLSEGFSPAVGGDEVAASAG